MDISKKDLFRANGHSLMKQFILESVIHGYSLSF